MLEQEGIINGINREKYVSTLACDHVKLHYYLIEVQYLTHVRV